MELQRVFVVSSKNGEVEIADPNPRTSLQGIQNLLSMEYPYLINSKIPEPEIKDDKVYYRFTESYGTKG